MTIEQLANIAEVFGLFMEDHKEWIERGFDDGVFLLVGSI